MALADFYSRAAVAASQVIQGFDEARFRDTLDRTVVGIASGEDALSDEGAVLTEMLVRLVARLYPRVALIDKGATRFESLAKQINPQIELTKDAVVGVTVGARSHEFADTLYLGAAGWDALLGTSQPSSTGESTNPFGAAAAACLGASWLFKRVFGLTQPDKGDDDVTFSAFHLERMRSPTQHDLEPNRLSGDAVLVGLGAIGNATAWVLGHSPLRGRIHVVDPETVELSNMQRYVLTTQADENHEKVALLDAIQSRELEFVPFRGDLADFLRAFGYRWEYFMLALDSAEDRRTAQGSLPRWIANAWTQPLDLGVSVHPAFGLEGACVSCLYLPSRQSLNEDEIVAQTLGIPDRRMDVRTLLHSGGGVNRAFLDEIAAAVGQPEEVLRQFEGRPIRDLYSEGFCGGAVLPLGSAGRPRQDVHVPLAHQSALAGTLLAATLAKAVLGADPPSTAASRIDVMRPLAFGTTQPLKARRDGRCICDDAAYVSVYEKKYQ